MSRIRGKAQDVLVNALCDPVEAAFTQDLRRDFLSVMDMNPARGRPLCLAVRSSHFEGCGVVQHLLLTSSSGGLDVTSGIVTCRPARSNVGLTEATLAAGL